MCEWDEWVDYIHCTLSSGDLLTTCQNSFKCDRLSRSKKQHTSTIPGFQYQSKAVNQLTKSIQSKLKVGKVFTNKVQMAPNGPYKFVVGIDQIVLVSI